MWTPFSSDTASHRYILDKTPNEQEQRFFKPLTTYLVGFASQNLIINLYYQSSLEAFQGEEEEQDVYELNLSLSALVDKLFFIV